MSLLIIHIILDWEEPYAEDSLVTRFSSPSSLVVSVRFVRDEVVARARCRDGPSRKEEENGRRRFEFGSRSRREREREGACAKKVRNGFGVWEASWLNEGNFPLDGLVVEHSSTKRQVNLH